MGIARLLVALLIGSSALGPTGALAAGPQQAVLDPPVQRDLTAAEVPADSTPNIRFVKNIPYSSGTDVEFGRFTVRKLDQSGNPICVRDESGACLVDDNGDVVYETQVRDYAFAGAQNNAASVRIVDITVPESAAIVATVNCNVSQADIQIREDLGLLVIGVDSNSNSCGMGGTQGIIIVDISDPRFPRQLSVFKSARGAHNATLHPTQPLVYLSDSDVANAGLGAIPIVDVSNPSAPTLVRTLAYHVHSPHDIAFNATGTRAYAASVSHTDILNTTDPRNPSVIASIHDPSINIHHDAQATPDGRTLIIGDELAGAAAGPQCPGGGLHFYDITDEASPKKTGVFFAETTKSLTALCTAHVFRIDPDGKTMTIGWYNGGTRVLDISDPTGLGAVEMGRMVPSGVGGNPAVANSWASKKYRGYIYSNDRARGLDIMKWDPDVPAATGSGRAVIGVIDTGINPYHEEFRWDSPLAFQHPSTYIPGYPQDAVALPITLDEPDYWKAVKKDCNTIWKNVQNGKLYWFPGTKVIGGISFGNVAGMTNCTPAQPTGGRILDTGGHGTMTASRATANTYGACRECLVVAIQMPTSVNLLNPASSSPPAIESIRFAGNNSSWIDAQSNSWGPIAFPGWEPTGQAGLLTANPALVRAVEEVSQKHPAFWASGNGVAGRGGVLGSPTLATPSLTPSAISVGGYDSGYVNTWPGFPPHLTSDSCNAWAAAVRSTDQSGDSVAGGTSGATPYVAGGAARILLEARSILGDSRTGVRGGDVAVAGPGVTPPAAGPLSDGKLTMAEWKDLVFKTATPRPVRQYEDGSVCNDPLDAPFVTTPVKWASLPAAAPTFWFVGYGAVDRVAVKRALDVLLGSSAMPVRTVEDAYFTGDRTVRSVTYEVYSRP